MNGTTTSAKTPKRKQVAAFFVLTFGLSFPFYILGTFAPKEMDGPVSILITFVPMISALILTFRENGSDGAMALLRRSFDFKRITRIVWYVPIVLLMPIVYLAAFLVLGFTGEAVGESVFPLGLAPVLLIMFFFMALGEEVGWTGYAYDPMEERWNASKAGLILGVIWAVWHIPLSVFVVEQSLVWAAAQVLVHLGFRVLLVWVYNNTGKSLFAVILCHGVSNVIPAALRVLASPGGPVISAVLVIVIAVIITRVWDPKTLIEWRK
jgi:membrane protease YdiL (CAAX protease family)